MKFFYPDSLDFVDPDYDFEEERHQHFRVRHRTDRYAHELLERQPYDGILVSKAIVEPLHGKGRYRQSQRLRLLRSGAERFFRLIRPGGQRLESMGDCGAYAYVNSEKPPYTVDEVLDFYENCGFDYVLSVDHVIPGILRNGRNAKGKRQKPLSAWRARQELTLSLAQAFLQEHRVRGHVSVPIGVAQGWDPTSYEEAVRALQAMGYRYIALGGLASAPTDDMMACSYAACRARHPGTKVHLLGVSRTEHLAEMSRWGIVSFDSTMPLRQAFMDDKHNYHTRDSAYLAIRLPQVAGNSDLRRKITRQVTGYEEARRLEQRSLRMLRQFGSDAATVSETIAAIRDYEVLFNGRDHSEPYRRLLTERPWEQCPCVMCRTLGIDIVIFRGRERNKRRGFHNMQVLYERLQSVALAA
jgi:hypothetical protein